MGKGVFFTSATMLLAVIITTTFRHHHRHHNHLNNHSSSTAFPSNASQLLRSNGFNFMATILHISPDLFLSTPQTTIFAIPDTSISNLSVPPYMMKHFIAYHISPVKLTFQDLFKKPVRTCLPTLVKQQKVGISKHDNKKRVLEINNVLITHPDLFLHGPVIIHGLAGSFATFDHHQESIDLPVCVSDHNDGFTSISRFIKKDEWGKVVKFLSKSGFMPFAIGLNSETDKILKDFPDLNSVTIFTPPNVALKAVSSPLLEKFMRFHIVPQRYSFKQLAGLPPGASLRTLVTGKHVEITETSKLSQVVFINGVAITASDLFVSKNFVVHGIARPLSMDELSSMSR